MSLPQPVPAPVRPFPITPRSLLVLGAACWLLFAIVTVLMTNGLLSPFDRAGLLIWRGPNPPSEFVLESVRDLTALGGVLLRNLFAIVAVAALVILQRFRAATWVFTTVAVGWALNSAAKLIVYRARPDFLSHWTEAVGPSFPSGHSFNGAVVCLALGLVFSGFERSAPLRRLIVGTAIVLSLAVAWSRVWLGVHYPSDVIAGWLGGAGWVCLSAALASRWLRDGSSHPAV